VVIFCGQDRAGRLVFLKQVPRITHGNSKTFLTHTACRAWPRFCVAQSGPRLEFLTNSIMPLCTTQKRGSIKTIRFKNRRPASGLSP
jgi:hypothetical protein